MSNNNPGNSHGGGHGGSHGSSNAANNSPAGNNYSHRRPSTNSRTDFSQQQAMNFLYSQQAYAYYQNPAAPLYAPYGNFYPEFQAYNNVPFQARPNGFQTGYYNTNQPSYNHRNSTRNAKNHSASASPVAHKNLLNYNKPVGPVSPVPGLASPALPVAGVNGANYRGSTASSVSGTPHKQADASPVTNTVGGKISIKNSNGEDISLSALASKSQTPSNVTTPKVNNSNLTATVVTSPAKVQSDNAVNEFKARIQAIARAKAEEKARAQEKAKAEAKEKEEKEKPVEKVEEKKSEEKAVEKSEEKSEEQQDVTKETESVKESEPEAAKTVPEEASRETPEATTEPTTEEAPEPVQEPVSEATAEETETHSAPGFSLTDLTNALKKATPISNPFTFSYPADFQGPDLKLKPVFEKTHKVKYDPGFLIQFQKPLELYVDEEWNEKYGSLISIAEQNQRGNSMRNASNFRNSPSGFGTGSNIGGSRGSNIGGNLRSQSNLRKNFGGDSKAGSRQSSRRRGGGAGSRRGENRSDSKRNNSKKYSKESDSKIEEALANIQNKINQTEKDAEPVKPLEKSATRWVPRSLRTKTAEVKKNPDGTDFMDEEEVKRKTKSYLNKLTLEMFDSISDDIINVAKQSKFETDAKTLKQVLELTFAKACDEPHWSSMYAQLCAKMVKIFPEEVKDETMLDKKTGVPAAGGILVRKCLLTRCQIEYEKGWTDKLPTNADGTPLEAEMMSDEYYIAAAAKRRGLGLVRFIGELYALGLVSEHVLIICLNGQSKNVTDPSEDTLENLAQLVSTVGPVIDRNPNPTKAKVVLDSVFERINVLVTLPISSRIKFKLMDLLDFRAKKWNDKSLSKGPQTIAEIHQEARKQRQEEERKKNDKRGGSNKRYYDSNQGSKWDQVQTVSKNDILNFGVVRNSSEKTLGPMNNFNKRNSRQSSTSLAASTRENSRRSPSNPNPPSNNQASEERSSKTNMFHVLVGDDGEEQDESDESDTEEKETSAVHESNPEKENQDEKPKSEDAN